MRLLTIGQLATIFTFALAAPTFAAPISLRGVDWSMSEAEQVAALESEGLVCLREPGWDGFTPPSSSSEDMADPLPLCFAEKGEGADVAALRQAYGDWLLTCRQVGGSSPACFQHAFKTMLDRLVMVRFQRGGRIIFDCEFLGSCGYSAEQVVQQLQRQVLNVQFRKPSEDAFIVCGTGENSDQICLHLVSSDIWLIQNPSGGTMRF